MSKSPTSWTFRWRRWRSLVRGTAVGPEVGIVAERWQPSERSRELPGSLRFLCHRLPREPGGTDLYSEPAESDRSGIANRGRPDGADLFTTMESRMTQEG